MANYTEQELINAATNGEGIKTGDSWNDQFGVAIPREFARFIRAIGESVGVQRWSDSSYITYTDHAEDDGVVRMEQSDITEVMTVISDPRLLAALNAYADGDSWEESGMSEFNDLILGNSASGISPEQKNGFAEQYFWYYFIRNYGDIDDVYLSQQYTSTKVQTGSELSNYFNSAANEYMDLEGRYNLKIDLKYMLAELLEPVNEAVGYGATEPIDVPPEEEDYSVVPLVDSNYYTKQLATYETNYNAAIKKVENIIAKLTALYNSFTGATGNDITKIRNDLTALVNDLEGIKTKISTAQQKTFDNAFSCARCYNNWLHNEKYHDVGINESNGHVYGYITVPNETSKRDPDLLDVFIGSAKAEELPFKEKYVEATIEEMLNS